MYVFICLHRDHLTRLFEALAPGIHFPLLPLHLGCTFGRGRVVVLCLKIQSFSSIIHQLGVNEHAKQPHFRVFMLLTGRRLPGEVMRSLVYAIVIVEGS